jgi:hypothetical protein
MPPVRRFQSKLNIAVSEETRYGIEKEAISKGVTVSDIARDLLASGLQSKGLLG